MNTKRKQELIEFYQQDTKLCKKININSEYIAQRVEFNEKAVRTLMDKHERLSKNTKKDYSNEYNQFMSKIDYIKTLQKDIIDVDKEIKDVSYKMNNVDIHSNDYDYYFDIRYLKKQLRDTLENKLNEVQNND